MEGERGAASDDEVGHESAKRGDELLGIKLRRGISIGKRGGPFTPVPSWKMEPLAAAGHSSSSLKINNKPSARKLGASLWEAQELLPKTTGSRIRSKPPQLLLSDASETNSPRQTHITSRLMRRVGASFDKQPKVTEMAGGDFQPESPASYNSSVEVSSLNRAIISSLDIKLTQGESGYSVKTSAELIKVLNRIWRLEEQLASSLSLVKTLKLDLRHAHSRIQKLMQEQESYRNEMDDVLKRVSEDRVTRKNKERDRIKAAVESIKSELEDERKMRRRSESLHHQLGKELDDVHSAFNETLNNLDSEIKTHGLLDELCDEFAKGILEYEQEICNQNQKFGKDCNHRFDQSLHHISKVWMDAQLHIRIAEANGEASEKNKILKRLAVEVTEFLQARRSYGSRNNGACQKGEKASSLRRQSLESVHLNGAAGAPQDAEDDDSVVSDLNCFELSMDVKDNGSQSYLKDNHEGGMEKLKGKSKATFRNEKLKYTDNIDGHDICKLKQARTESCDEDNIHVVVGSRENPSHTGSRECRVPPDNNHNDSCNHLLTSSHVTPICNNNASGSSDSCYQATHVAQWNYRNTSSDPDISKSSSRIPPYVKENSLKEKLLEARLEGKNARMRALKGSSIDSLRNRT